LVMADLYLEIVKLRQNGSQGALATIVRHLGSTPRKDNAKMLIRDDGSSLGSVGGGCVEAEIWSKAQEVIRSGQATLLSYAMTDEDAEKDGLICGGTVEIFIEPILANPQLIIMGAGHLGQAIARLAGPLGFEVSVLDDRDSFASEDRFPDADRLIVDSFDSGLEQLKVRKGGFILVVTRGHRHDQMATESAIQTQARYVGLVGSRRKIKIIVENLLEKGLCPDSFRRLYAPIGLDIGSETPEEIAVSVMAELIALRKGRHQRSEKQKFVLALLEGRKSDVSDPVDS
jgi:xanthine dehydrogenase accessory factor